MPLQGATSLTERDRDALMSANNARMRLLSIPLKAIPIGENRIGEGQSRQMASYTLIPDFCKGQAAALAKVAAMGPQEAVRQAEKPGRKAVMSGGLRFLGLPDMNLVRSMTLQRQK